ncbi:MAG: serine--tRNA ligase [Nitrososphaerales archaeon]
MLDIKLIRENPELIKEMLRKRGISFPLDRLINLDQTRRALITEVQKLKHQRNLVSEEIGNLKKQGMDISKKIVEMKDLSNKIQEIDYKIQEIEKEFNNLMLQLPNLIHDSVPEGKDENDNVVIRSWGEPTQFDFEPKDHIDLGLKLGLIDLDRAAKVAGARFYYLKGDLVLLNYALIHFALDFMKGKGFTLVQPPYMLKREAMSGAIILSDFEDVIYKLEGEDLYLIGTSEHALAAMHMNEVLDGKDLPLRYTGMSPCFRKEAGAHGRDTKGIFRVHQFEKVEQFVFSKPEDSWKEHEFMISNAEEFFRKLGIPYRVVLLCSGDMGKVAAKTYDLEAWFPGQGKYREVVSCSNCTDYQARRLNIKYRDKPHEEAKFVHTLNSTLVATERALIAIMENYQQKDGSIAIPEALQPYMGGLKVITG